MCVAKALEVKAAGFGYVTVIISSKNSGKAEGRSLGRGTVAV